MDKRLENAILKQFAKLMGVADGAVTPTNVGRVLEDKQKEYERSQQ